jgi:hypothetical protein
MYFSKFLWKFYYIELRISVQFRTEAATRLKEIKVHKKAVWCISPPPDYFNRGMAESLPSYHR